ncbi:hypothetical protein D3C72_1826200 [compost metagenome]
MSARQEDYIIIRGIYRIQFKGILKEFLRIQYFLMQICAQTVLVDRGFTTQRTGHCNIKSLFGELNIRLCEFG